LLAWTQTLLFLFLKIYEKIEKNIERNFAKNFAINYEKKILGTSDAWWIRQSSQGPTVLHLRLSDL
jgi:hypothetical protein